MRRAAALARWSRAERSSAHPAPLAFRFWGLRAPFGRLRGLFWVELLGGALLAAACAATPKDYERVRAENDLLKAQIEVIKRNCSYYRAVEVEAEDEKP